MNARPSTPKALLLQEPGDYNNRSFIQPQPGRNGAYSTMTLFRGLLLFRGEHGTRTEPSRDHPAYFSDMVSASIYTRGDPDKLYAYRVKRAPKLLVLSYQTLAKMGDDDRLTAEEREVLDQYVQVHKTIPYIIPVGFYKKTDAEGPEPLYLNRRILNMVCRLGYDGWVAMPETLIQRNMDTHHYVATGEVRFNLNPYNPEIALCDWTKFLEPLK